MPGHLPVHFRGHVSVSYDDGKVKYFLEQGESLAKITYCSWMSRNKGPSHNDMEKIPFFVNALVQYFTKCFAHGPILALKNNH
jgi:hypothetical protein